MVVTKGKTVTFKGTVLHLTPMDIDDCIDQYFGGAGHQFRFYALKNAFHH